MTCRRTRLMTRRTSPLRRSIVFVALLALSATVLVGLAAAAPAKQPATATAAKTSLPRTAAKPRRLAQTSSDRLAPSAPSGLRVAWAGAGSVSVTWNRSADNVAVKGYGLYRGSARVDSIPGTKYTFRQLTCGMSYVLGVDAFDAAGNRSARAQVVAATSPCKDLQAPPPPGNLQQTGGTADTATISWSPPAGETIGGYGVYLGTLQVGTTQSTAYTFSQLACGTTREVGVDAYDLAGNRSPIATYFVTTAACPDTQAPTAPGAVSQTGATASSMSLAWGPASDNVGVAGYDVAVAGTTVRTSSPSVQANGLACGTSYQVAVRAVDASGNRSAQTGATAATTACAPHGPTPTSPSPSPDASAPATPAGLAVGASTGTGITVSWQPSTDDLGVAGYGLYRNGARLANVTATSYTFGGLQCGASYELGVDAVDAAGNRSGMGRIVASAAPCGDSTAPPAPTDLVATDRTETSIAVRWAQPTATTDVVGYRLYRGGTLVGETAGNTFTFAGLTCATSYSLGVAARDAAGNQSAQTVTLAVTLNCPDTTPPPAPTGLNASNVTQTGATLGWSASAGAALYGLSVNGTGIGTTTQTSYAFSGLACGTASVLGVEAIDAAGNRSTRATLAVTTVACSPTPPPPPPPPSGSAQVALSPTGNDSTCVRGDLSKPCQRFQRAYDVAQAGDTISVAPGTYPADTPSRDASEIYGGSKAVTFTCASTEKVTTNAGFLQVFADNVTIRGECFQLHALRVGLGGDARSIKGFLLEDAKLDGLEVVGAEATIRRVEIGPNVSCFAVTDTSVPLTSRCDPNSPWEVERFWAYRGTPDGFQTYLHANGAGINAKVLLDQVWIHDVQTRDDERAHTGCGLIWNNTFDTSPNQIVIRNSRFERCAILDWLVDGGHGITLEGNYFGPPVEPLDNVGFDYSRSAQVAGAFAKEFGPRSNPINNAPWQVYNYRVVGNTFTNGMGLDTAQTYPFVSTLVDGNYLGKENVCWPGATYGANSGTASCGSQPLATAPPIPPAG